MKMRPYGVDRKDFGCCPGCDKFPLETYVNRKSKKARERCKRIAHKRARARISQFIYKELKEYFISSM